MHHHHPVPTMSIKFAIGFAALHALAACDSGEGSTDAAPAIDAAPPTAAPPPPLTGRFHLRFERTGGDCPAHLPGAWTAALDESGGTLRFERQGTALVGTRDGDAVEASGVGETQVGGCTVREDTTFTATVRPPGNAFTAVGRTTYTPAGVCAFSTCTAEWTGRAARVGGTADGAWSTLDLDPSDTAVEAATEFQNAAWFATASAGGGRLWRLVNDAGVPSVTPQVTEGFRSEYADLAGNNQAIRSLLATPERLYAGTFDAPDGTPAGNGFDLWTFDGTTWTALTTDGLGDPARIAVDSLAMLDDVLYLGIRSAGGAQIWRQNAGFFEQVFPVEGTVDAAHAQGPRDPRHCATEVTSLVVHSGRLHAALGGADCTAGAFILRLESPQVPEWTLLSEGGLGDVTRHSATLASDGTELFALGHGQSAAILRHAGGRHWVTHTTDGLGEPGARGGARSIPPPARGFLFFPFDGEGPGSLWATQGGADPRDFIRIAGGESLADTRLGPAVVFEERLFVGTANPPARLLRAATLLAEQGAGTVITAHDRATTAARGAGTACHRSGAFFNPALQADQALRVVLPPGVEAADDVLLPALYVLPPDLKVPPPGADATDDARAPRLAAWLEAAAATHGPLVACLFGRPTTLGCAAGEGDIDCLHRCLAAVPTLEEVDGFYRVGPAQGPDAATALLATLGTPTLPVIERMALVLVDLGAGYAVDAADEAPWTPVLPARDAEAALWPGEIGAYASALRAAVAEVDRCWPRSIRPSANARYLVGHGRGAFSAVQALLARDDTFNGALAFDGTFTADRLIEDPAGRALIASIAEPFRGVANGSLPPIFLGASAEAPCAACETAAFCDALAAAGQPGVAFSGAGHHILAPALVALSTFHRGQRPGPITCAALPAGDCAACGVAP